MSDEHMIENIFMTGNWQVTLIRSLRKLQCINRITWWTWTEQLPLFCLYHLNRCCKHDTIALPSFTVISNLFESASPSASVTVKVTTYSPGCVIPTIVVFKDAGFKMVPLLGPLKQQCVTVNDCQCCLAPIYINKGACFCLFVYSFFVYYYNLGSLTTKFQTNLEMILTCVTRWFCKHYGE